MIGLGPESGCQNVLSLCHGEFYRNQNFDSNLYLLSINFSNST